MRRRSHPYGSFDLRSVGRGGVIVRARIPIVHLSRIWIEATQATYLGSEHSTGGGATRSRHIIRTLRCADSDTGMGNSRHSESLFKRALGEHYSRRAILVLCFRHLQSSHRRGVLEDSDLSKTKSINLVRIKSIVLGLLRPGFRSVSRGVNSGLGVGEGE